VRYETGSKIEEKKEKVRKKGEMRDL